MKERQILFSAPMVRAILDGSKTQTRRVVKPQPNTEHDSQPYWHIGGYRAWQFRGTKDPLRMGTHNPIACPYGQPGDRLWVPEAFDFLPTGGPTEPQACEIVYWATGSHESRTAPSDYNPMIYGHEKVRPSIHMPRWASRITLEVTGVRVERLQDISEADAIAEGIDRAPSMGKPGAFQWCDYRLPRDPSEWFNDPVRSYQSLWDLINGPGSWDANPWVWVVEFKCMEGAIP